MNSKRTAILIILIVVILLAIVAVVFVSALLYASRIPRIGVGGEVALIRVEGVIASGQGSGGLFGDGIAGAERIVDLLEQFRNDGSIKSAVLRINSPGGSAAGSQEIYQQIMRVRREGKKIIVSMGDVAASGGYYIASAADRIYADPATLTGSIGVIMETADLHELLDRLGINLSAVKSGEHKDMGSVSRPMTPEEQRIAQSLIDDVFDQFVTDVSKGRKMPKPEVRKLADGRVYTGRQALNLKLIDRLGSLQDACETAARDAGIKGDFTVVEYEQPGFFDLFFGNTRSQLPSWLQRGSRLHEFAQKLLLSNERIEFRTP